MYLCVFCVYVPVITFPPFLRNIHVAAFFFLQANSTSSEKASTENEQNPVEKYVDTAAGIIKVTKEKVTAQKGGKGIKRKRQGKLFDRTGLFIISLAVVMSFIILSIS